MQHSTVSPGSVKTLVRRGGITNGSMLSQQNLHQKLQKLVDVHCYSVLHQCRFFIIQCGRK